MDAIRLVTTIFFVILALKTCDSAMGQDAEFPVANVQKYDSSEHFSYLTDAQAVPPLVRVPDEPKLTLPSMTHPQAYSFGAGDRSFFSDPYPRFYFQVGALLFQQKPQFGGQPIVVDNNNNKTLLSTSNFDSTFNPGLQATMGGRLANGRVVEFDYMGLYGGSTSTVATKPDPNAFLTFPNNLAGNVFVDTNRVQVNYASSFSSFALNTLGGCCGNDVKCGAGCSEIGCGKGGFGVVRCQSPLWFAGFRYINFNDRLNISAQRIVGGMVENGTYKTTTNNNLYGAQLGARLRRTSGRFGWDATSFGGVFYNDASQTQSVTDFPNFAIRPSVSNNKGGVAFVGGGNLSALYSLNNVWSLRTGYSVLWIQNLAFAPNQLDFNFAAAQGGSQLHNSGGLLLHGVTAGLEARW